MSKVRLPWDKHGKPRIPISGGIPNPADVPKMVKDEVGKIVPDEVEKALKEVLETAMEEFFKLASKGLLDKFFRVMKAAAPDELWGPTMGPLSFTISDVPKKMGLLEYWGKHPPTSKDKLKRMIGELKPDTVEITVKGNVPGLPSLSVGGTLVYKTDTFKERLDALWNEVKP